MPDRQGPGCLQVPRILWDVGACRLARQVHPPTSRHPRAHAKVLRSPRQHWRQSIYLTHCDLLFFTPVSQNLTVKCFPSFLLIPFPFTFCTEGLQSK